MYLKDKGPIPFGTYEVTQIGTSKGPRTLRLIPIQGTDVKNRDNFLIHGDNSKMNHTASNGCIIVGPKCREKVEINDIIEVEELF